MIFRQNILAQLDTDLKKLKVSNGYNNNLDKNIVRGFTGLDNDVEYPNVFYMLGSETVQDETEDNENFLNTLDIMIGVNFTADGSLTDYYESIIADIKAFIHRGNTECFDYNEVQNRDGVSGCAYKPQITNIEPYIDFDSNKGTVLIVTKIDYEETI